MIFDNWSYLGLFANLLYTIRVLIQWLASEKAGRSLAPKSFWWISLFAAMIMVIYSVARTTDVELSEDPNALPLLVGYIITIVPYMRNLMLSYNVRKKWHILSYAAGAAIFMVCLILLVNSRTPIIRTPWFYVGAAGSFIWYSRFIWQWINAEKEKKSFFPVSFWYISLAGMTLILIYSLAMGDPVYILGFIFNFIPVTRNIILTHRRRASEESARIA